MSDRRHWSEDEQQKLIELVQKNYEFLTAALTPSKTKVMVKNRWKEITDEINSHADGVPLSVLQVQRKWSDEKSRAKKAVTNYRKEAGKLVVEGTLLIPLLNSGPKLLVLLAMLSWKASPALKIWIRLLNNPLYPH